MLDAPTLRRLGLSKEDVNWIKALVAANETRTSKIFHAIARCLDGPTGSAKDSGKRQKEFWQRNADGQDLLMEILKPVEPEVIHPKVLEAVWVRI